jgi:hypothetical protein
MLKSKWVFGLAAMVMVLALAQSGYAQLQISVIGNPAPRDTNSNRTAETNDPETGNGIIITGTYNSSVFVTGGRLRLDWPGTITNSKGFPVTDPIQIAAADGIFAGVTNAQLGVDNGEGRIHINLPCSVGTTNATGTLILTGVRLDVVGQSAPVTASVSSQNVTSLSSTGSAPAPGPGCPGAPSTASPTVATNVNVLTPTIESITTLSPGIGSIATGISSNANAGTNENTATIFTNRTVADAKASFVVTEGHRTAWFDATQFAGATMANDAGVRLTFSGIPTGVTLNISAFLPTSISSSVPAPGITVNLSRSAITTDLNTTTVTWTGTVPTGSTLDQLQVTINSITVPTSGSLAPGTISVSAQMNPLGGGFDVDSGTVDTSALPRYAEAVVGSTVIAIISPANTTLLIPFAVRDGAFDTGISLANTTNDPFGSSTGGATLQSGGLRLDFYPRAASGAATPFSVVTSSTVKPGLGLSADGALAAGSTWTVLLSELLGAAGQTGPFTGYIFIRADFLNAHGAPFVSDFRNFTSFTPMLVLASPGITPRSGGTTAVEALHF